MTKLRWLVVLALLQPRLFAQDAGDPLALRGESRLAPAADPYWPQTPAQDDAVKPGQTAAESESEFMKARFFKNPREFREEIIRRELTPWFFYGAEAEAQSQYERRLPDRKFEAFLDSVALGAEANYQNMVMARLVEKYDFHDVRGFETDESLVRLFGTEQVPWYCEFGHTSTRFGDFTSHFHEDPSTQVLGEVEAYELSAGYDRDAEEFSLGVFKGKDGSSDYDLTALASYQIVKNLDVGAYWTNDISESKELRKLRNDSPPDNPTDYPGSPSIMGGGAFLTWETDDFDVDFEYTTALRYFDAGALTDNRDKPWAFNSEFAWRPIPRWELAVRFETSSGIPDTPNYQVGVATSYGIFEHATVSLEYLHGFFPGEPDRDLIVMGLVLLL